jgi:hypothetical protein
MLLWSWREDGYGDSQGGYLSLLQGNGEEISMTDMQFQHLCYLFMVLYIGCAFGLFSYLAFR